MKIRKVTIVGWVYFGGSLGMHAEYQLLVSSEDPVAQWSIYRRYSLFEKLYKQIGKMIGENKARELGILFPAKNYFGSRLNATGEAIGNRMVELQAFLSKVIQAGDLNHENQLVHDFLDQRGRGLSGAMKGIPT
ncbi:hypothetical protein EON65_32850 [archaeon]|nr:MAG: hypothetical protein EON65_32850 [archaeon]